MDLSNVTMGECLIDLTRNMIFIAKIQTNRFEISALITRGTVFSINMHSGLSSCLALFYLILRFSAGIFC